MKTTNDPINSAPNTKSSPLSVVDLFSGAGGMSFGFHEHPAFKLIAAADAEIGKPSMGQGSLQCNNTYALNNGIQPAKVDLGAIEPNALAETLGIQGQKVHVLCVCPPCTGFSRANPMNHIRDDHRNSLVQRAGAFTVALDADVMVMENARELLSGNFRSHFLALSRNLEAHGYKVSAANHLLTRYGLPQIRERALIIAVKSHLTLRTLEELWAGFEVKEEAVSVRKAFAGIDPRSNSMDQFPRFADPDVADRLAAIPANGGSWTDLISHPRANHLLTNAMKHRVKMKKLGSHPDVYGRLWWDRPAPTIKRECAHIGNGRYAHPEEHRLCTVREMAMLQGFPNHFIFNGGALSNHYRHIGDAVPPLISHQIAWICHWMFTGEKPALQNCLLPGTHLRSSDLSPAKEDIFAYA